MDSSETEKENVDRYRYFIFLNVYFSYFFPEYKEYTSVLNDDAICLVSSLVNKLDYISSTL